MRRRTAPRAGCGKVEPRPAASGWPRCAPPDARSKLLLDTTTAWRHPALAGAAPAWIHALHRRDAAPWLTRVPRRGREGRTIAPNLPQALYNPALKCFRGRL